MVWLKGLRKWLPDCRLTNKTVIVHRKVAEDAKRMNIFLSADPGGIGSAFHRAEEGRKENDPHSGDTKNHSRGI